MSDINRIAAMNVTDTTVTLLNSSTPKLIKTILMGNGLETDQNLSLMIDNIQFMFTVPASSTLISFKSSVFVFICLSSLESVSSTVNPPTPEL